MRGSKRGNYTSGFLYALLSSLLASMLFINFSCCSESGKELPVTCSPAIQHITPTGIEVEMNKAYPRMRFVSYKAEFLLPVKYSVQYRWKDDKLASTNTRPPITVKFGTLEKGTFSDPNAKDAHYDPQSKWWFMSSQTNVLSSKEADAKGAVLIGSYVLTVTLQQPAVRLPEGAPTLKLPGIGIVLGSETRPVMVDGTVEYCAVIQKQDGK
jgi:hypothetical protein